MHTMTRFAAETSTGIAYLHLPDVAIVHGDMKAANVLLTSGWSIRIADFGMAEAKDRSKSMSSLRQGSNSSGLTVAWAAPELLKNEGSSFATDVFALGMTLWEIFERSTPFGRMSEVVVISQLLKGVRPQMTDKTPLRVATVIKACWAQDPLKRCNATEAASALTKTRSPSWLPSGSHT